MRRKIERCGDFGLKMGKKTLCKASKAEDRCLRPAMFINYCQMSRGWWNSGPGSLHIWQPLQIKFKVGL